MIQQDIIDEHAQDQPVCWVSNVVLAPKPDNGVRVTLDAQEVNKAIMPINAPIPRQEDITAKLNVQDAKYSPKWNLNQYFGK